MPFRPILAAFLFCGLLAALQCAHAAPVPWDDLPQKERDVWQRSIGLEGGIALMHCVQPISAAAGEIPWKGKHWVATAGCIVYGGNTVALAYRQKWALWVNVIGPGIGLSTVLIGSVVTRNSDNPIRPDVPQVVGGVLQFWAAFEAVRLLVAYGKRGESLLHHRPTKRVSLVPTGNGVGLVGIW